MATIGRTYGLARSSLVKKMQIFLPSFDSLLSDGFMAESVEDFG